ncbi:MAG: ArnT family glycosyltransferase [Chloroflexota bacterium]
MYTYPNIHAESSRPEPGASAARLGAVLLAVLILAGVLRFWLLPSRGLIFWDEGKFALEGLRMQAAMHSLFSGSAILDGKAVGTAKPGHALLIALAYSLLGFGASSALALNAAASLAAVAILFLICLRLFDARIATISAALLAVSQYDIIYARSALSESDGLLFFLLAVLAWTYAWERIRRLWLSLGQRRLLLPAILLGIAFTINYRLVVYAAALIAFDLLAIVRADSWRRMFRRLIVWLVGFAIVPLVWVVLDGITRAHGLTLFRDELTGMPTTYLQEIVQQLHGGGQSSLHFSPGSYAGWFLDREGVSIAVLFAIGAVLALVRPTFPRLLAFVLVVFPYAVYSIAPFIVPRSLHAAVPFAVVLAADALISIFGSIRGGSIRNAILLLLPLLLIAQGAFMSWPLTDIRSGYAAAAHFVRAHGDRAVVTNEILVFYLEARGSGCTAAHEVHRFSLLPPYRRTGFTLVVLDHPMSKLSPYVRRSFPRVATFPAAGSPKLGADLIRAEHFPQSRAFGLRAVDVFRIPQSVAGGPARVPASSCSRERV